MNAQQEQQFEADFDKFITSGDFLFVAKDKDGAWTLEEALRRLRFYTKLFCDKNNGYSSQSAFRIVADALASDTDPTVKIVAMARGEEQEEIVPDFTAEEYRRIPVRTIQMRFKNDPDFKRQVESLIARGLI
jgi:hypothetical protein